MDADWPVLETQRSFQVATTGLGCMAMMEAGRGPAHFQALDRGIDYLLANAALKRPGGWDTDNVWGYLYGLAALAEASGFPRYQGPDQEERRTGIRSMGETLLRKLDAYQTPLGGWGYYDVHPYTARPTWATSFCTAVGILGILSARKEGWKVDEGRLQRAVRALARCRLPGGAYAYDVAAIPAPDGLDGLNQVKGSLSRIQVGNLALVRAKEAGLGPGATPRDLLWGIQVFLQDHRFLDIARLRPVPHEAFYYNSGYFYFFGHFYAATVLGLLPEKERRRLAPRLWEEVLKTQAPDGSMWDFYMNDFGKPYGVAFGVLALQRSLKAVSP